MYYLQTALNFYIYELICQIFFCFISNFYIFLRMPDLPDSVFSLYSFFHQHFLCSSDQFFLKAALFFFT